jgi:hypothetical protein
MISLTINMIQNTQKQNESSKYGNTYLLGGIWKAFVECVDDAAKPDKVGETLHEVAERNVEGAQKVDGEAVVGEDETGKGKVKAEL